jgi:hypothetical protein
MVMVAIWKSSSSIALASNVKVKAQQQQPIGKKKCSSSSSHSASSSSHKSSKRRRENEPLSALFHFMRPMDVYQGWDSFRNSEFGIRKNSGF